MSDFSLKIMNLRKFPISKYRAEIDGLRAIAVIPVILFHAGFEQFSGGFVGVDIFFVISGYLITTIIMSDINQGTFSLADFYERRARRILPALFIVVAVSIPFAWLLLTPSYLKGFLQSVFSVATFSSNILFWNESGYFDQKSELKPLLHTWSLAVEEQFYIIFPLLLIALSRLGRRVILATLVLLFVVSLLVAQWASINKPEAAFFLLHTRGWELLMGAFCAFYLFRFSSNNLPFIDQCGSLIGITLIITSIFIFDPVTPIPGIFALVPTVGAALVILFANENSIVKEMLSNRIFVFLGLLSYSAYLWHQPLFAFARHNLPGDPGAIVFASLICLTFALAYFSWRFIETPFRCKTTVPPKVLFSVSAASAIALASLGLIGHQNNQAFDANTHYAPNIKWASLGEKIKSQGEACERENIANTKWLLGCSFGDVDAENTVVLYGDSHGQALSYSLDEALKKARIRGITLSIDGCELIPQIRKNKNISVSDCDSRFEELLDFVHELKADLIVTSRWMFWLYPIEGHNLDMPYRNSEGYTEIEDYREYDVLVDGEFNRDAASKRIYLKNFIEKLSAVSKNIFFLYPAPETGIDIEKFNRLHFRNNGEIPNVISTPFSDYSLRNKFVLDVFDSLELQNIKKVRTDRIFCNSLIHDRCVMQWGGVPYYYDDDHLSYEGANLVVREIERLADWRR